eukprot:m51a1_g261 hypothetical protein (433) ;mRNA; f:227977-229494
MNAVSSRNIRGIHANLTEEAYLLLLCPCSRAMARWPVARVLLAAAAVLVATVVLTAPLRWSAVSLLLPPDPAQALDARDRLLRAQTFLADPRTAARLGAVLSAQRAEVFVAVSSAPRDQPYVHRCVASLLRAAEAASPQLGVAAVVIDNSRATRHAGNSSSPDTYYGPLSTPAHFAKFDAHYERLVTRYLQRPALAPAKREALWINRQKRDYGLALWSCARSPAAPRYCLVLEDDAVLSRDALVRAAAACRELDARDGRWGMLRLFGAAEHWQGWSLRCSHAALLALFAAAGAAAGLVAARAMPPRARVAVALCCGAWCALAPVLAGKQSLPLLGARTGGSGVFADGTHEGVSSVAMAFRAEVAARVAGELLGRKQRGAVDVALARLVPETFYELRPNVADHAGEVSSSLAHKRMRVTSASYEAAYKATEPF